MLAARALPDSTARDAPCERCGQAPDSRHFDASGFAPLPQPGREAVLARIELAPQYCGVLEYFAQFTDAHARDGGAVETPGLQWVILVNRQVLDPYVALEHIANPWGYGSFPLRMRLPEGATVEFVVRRALASAALGSIARVGGRLAGRYWYDTSFGQRTGRNGHGSP